MHGLGCMRDRNGDTAHPLTTSPSRGQPGWQELRLDRKVSAAAAEPGPPQRDYCTIPSVLEDWRKLSRSILASPLAAERCVPPHERLCRDRAGAPSRKRI
jgi:hypothetical protein